MALTDDQSLNSLSNASLANLGGSRSCSGMSGSSSDVKTFLEAAIPVDRERAGLYCRCSAD